MGSAFKFGKRCDLKIEDLKTREEIEHDQFVKDNLTTIIFEKKFGVNIKTFKSMKEIDDFVEYRTGKKLEVTTIANRLAKIYDIDSLFDEARD